MQATTSRPTSQRRERGPRTRVSRWSVRLGLLGATALALGATLVTGPAGAQSSTSSVPGITPTTVTVGSISTLTGPIASNFESLVPGIQAYFSYINAKGGVNGRRLILKYNLDDGGNPSQFNSLTHTLIDQDHVFAVVGVATAFFTPNYFVETKTPTYGYNVTGNWSPYPNLFAAGGSTQCYTCGTPSFVWWTQQVHGTNVGIVALSVKSSNASCEAFGSNLGKAGIKVGYTDYQVSYGGNLAPDVQRMQQAGVNTIITCMDVNDNLSMARAIQQYGYKGVKQLWLNGNDQSTLDQYKNIMQGIYFSIAHVPFSYAKTAPATYPGMVAYLAAMKKYQPKWVYDEVAIQGWESAALFAQGLEMAGKNPTQAAVIRADNSIKFFTAGGLTAPVNWTIGHTNTSPPYCNAYIVVKGDQFVPALDKGNKSYVCFGANLYHPTMVPVPPGTPGG
ncbi:MAG TPA: ABC transporter substrate-binding protein [Acidimicrobiales bacterium]|nr:ABC transporter substrate-binding protein [Acidimicrobiales bacterium]